MHNADGGKKSKTYFDDFPLSIRKKIYSLYWYVYKLWQSLHFKHNIFFSFKWRRYFQKKKKKYIISRRVASLRPTGGLRLYKYVAGGDVCTPVLLDGINRKLNFHRLQNKYSWQNKHTYHAKKGIWRRRCWRTCNPITTPFVIAVCTSSSPVNI